MFLVLATLLITLFHIFIKSLVFLPTIACVILRLFYLQALSIHLFSVPSVVYSCDLPYTRTQVSFSSSKVSWPVLSSVPGQRVTLALSLCFSLSQSLVPFLSLPPARGTIEPPQCISSEGHFHLLTLPSIQRERYKWISHENGKALDIETSDE